MFDPHTARAARTGDLSPLAAVSPEQIQAQGDTGWTALMHASWAGHAHMVEALLARGAQPSASSLDGLTALMLAAGAGHADAVAALIEGGADLDAASWSGRTALESALQHQHLDVARALADAGAYIDEAMSVLWLRALAEREGHRCRLLERPEPRTGTWIWAIEGPIRLSEPDAQRLAGHILSLVGAPQAPRRVNLLVGAAFIVLPRKFDAHTEDHRLPARRWRERVGWTEHAEAILQRELDANQPDPWGRLATERAIEADRPDVLAALLRAGADPNARPLRGVVRGASLLVNASRSGKLGCAMVLMEHGADTEDATANGTTPLMAAAAGDHLDVVQELLKEHVSLEPRNAQGQTALTVAQARGASEAARALLVARNQHLLKQAPPAAEAADGGTGEDGEG